MSIEFYSKFVNFLKKHELYDEKVFQYIWEKALMLDYRDEDYSFLLGSCGIVIDRKRNLLDIQPCLPFLMDDKAVAMAIYAYINSLMLIPKVGRKYKENMVNNYVLPMFYEILYILENPTKQLLTYEQNMRNDLLKYGSHNYKTILNCVDQLVESYKIDNSSNKQIVRKAKRLARNYIK